MAYLEEFSSKKNIRVPMANGNLTTIKVTSKTSPNIKPADTHCKSKNLHQESKTHN